MGKDYRHGKHSKREFYGSERHDPQCRPNGTCGYCKKNRTHKTDKRIARCDEAIKEAEEK